MLPNLHLSYDSIYYGSLVSGAPMVTGDGEGDQDPSSWRGAG